ncbi:hypothetical protein [Campylobacter sp. 19-13652]|uniref:hypothetical protein n=1 Tax=Campylobacter sp. 19-13652 TaxID=2840180 RepID=UPI001C778045|nr:hypothetical protein [Campylobacter sp. 19-13652]BCX79048.1 hypothetical protein LBC_05100 [Campylobacter sp. 19-13652]
MARGIFILKRAFIFRTFLSFLLLLSTLKSEEYIFWARLETHDFMLDFNELNILPAMSQTSHPTLKQICVISLPSATNFTTDNNLRLDILNSKKDEIFNCFLSQQSRVSSWSELLNLNASNKTEIIIPPVRFVADFKAHYVIIYLISK